MGAFFDQHTRSLASPDWLDAVETGTLLPHADGGVYLGAELVSGSTAGFLNIEMNGRCSPPPSSRVSYDLLGYGLTKHFQWIKPAALKRTSQPEQIVDLMAKTVTKLSEEITSFETFTTPHFLILTFPPFLL